MVKELFLGRKKRQGTTSVVPNEAQYSSGL
jgi:hypothetical protein